MPRQSLATSRIFRYDFSYLVTHQDVSVETVKTKEGRNGTILRVFLGFHREADENSALLG